MDALEFLIERRRLCKSYTACNECPLKGARCHLDSSMSDEEYERAITTVEKWSKEHPCKTLQSVFQKQWPSAALDKYGISVLCPKTLNRNFLCNDKVCSDCRREFWMQEVEQ